MVYRIISLSANIFRRGTVYKIDTFKLYTTYNIMIWWLKSIGKCAKL